MVKICSARAFAFLIVFCAFFIFRSAHGAAVAMVTDLQGKATIEGPAKTRQVAILSELEPTTVLQLDVNATLSALYLESGDDYAFKGPALIRFNPGSPEVIKGSAAQRRAAPLGQESKNLRMRPVGVTQGAIVMRGVRPGARIRLLTLSGTKTLEARPEFRWQEVQPGINYEFAISDEIGQALHETRLQATSLRLPAEIRLREAVAYTWEVAVRLDDGRKYTSTGDFTVADTELRNRVETLRPAADSPFSSRVAFAAWLDSVELKDEARRYWRALAAERPGDLRLKELAAD
jgi:hypothetical protein